MATLTKLAGPSALGPGVKMVVYQADLATDGYYAAGGIPVDMSDDFDKIFSVSPAGVDTLADGGVVIVPILPAPSVAVSSSNVKLAAFWSADGTDGEPLKELAAAAQDLEGIGQLSLVVIGK